MFRALAAAACAALLSIPGAPAVAAAGAVDAEALLEARDFVRLEALARDSLGAAVAAHGELSPEALGARDLQVKIALRTEGVDEDLRALAAETVERKRQVYGVEHTEVAESLNLLGSVLDLLGSPDEARARMEEGLEMRRRVLGPGHPDVALSLFGLATLASRHGDVTGARDMLEEARNIQEAAGAPPARTAATFLALSWVQVRLGDVEAAVPRAERAVALYEEAYGRGHVRTAQSVNNLAAVLSYADRTGEAIETALRCTEILEGADPAWDWLRARVFNSLGEFERARGDFVAARDWTERSVALHERTEGPSSPAYAFALNSLGLLQLDLGDLVAARRSFERVREIYEATMQPDDPSVLFVLTDLASVELRSGDAKEAVRLLDRAVPGLVAAFGDSPDAAYALGSLGEARLAAGDPEGAREALERSAAMSESVFGPVSGDLARSLGLLARVHARTGDAAAAEDDHRRCLAITAEVFGDDSLVHGAELLAYARFLLENGEPARAFDLAVRAEDISHEHVRLNVSALAEREALAFLDQRARGTDVLLAVVAADPDGPRAGTAWNAVVHSRGQVLDEMIDRNRAIAAASDAGAKRAHETYRTAVERLAKLRLAQSEGGVPREEIEAAREDLDGAERSLAEVSASFRQARTRARAGLAEVAAARPEGSAVVGYVRYSVPARPGRSEERLLAFVLPADSDEPRVATLGPAAELEDRIRAWRVSLSGDETACREAGRRVREALWDPVQPLIGGAGLVLVVPDAGVHGVTFAALPDRGSGYLVESGPTFHYLSSERDAASAPPENAGEGLLVLGGASYDAEPGLDHALLAAADGSPAFRGGRADCADFATYRFAPLPATAAEAREVAARFGTDAVRLEGADATEAAFRARAPGHRVLHLATHGFFLGGECAAAAEGSRGVTGVAPLGSGPVRDVHPLLLSGLALAGANRRAEAAPGEDDGILTAQEIGTLDLRGVDWAVLSACDTGIGQVHAEEGVLGLQRAFTVAGARTVIMSLWPVLDEDARAWMAQLYEQRAQGATTADAVRAADRARLDALREAGDGTHPARWAAFVAVGDWR